MSSLLAIVPCKSKSTRLPGKNLMEINGVPLVKMAVDCAEEAGIFNDIALSTDSDEAWRLFHDGDAVDKHWRSKALSEDGVESAAVVMDVLSWYEYRHDAFCLLNPTSPCRTPIELIDAYGKFTDANLDCLASFGGGKHDGDFLFWRTVDFLKYISRSILPPNVMWALTNGIDINTEDDFKDAARTLRPRRQT